MNLCYIQVGQAIMMHITFNIATQNITNTSTLMAISSKRG